MTKTKEERELEYTHKAIVLANEHWVRLQSVLEKIYVDAFREGYKHGRKAAGE